MKHIKLCVLTLALLFTASSALAEPFTYQGSLEEAGAPADGLYDFIFELYNAPTGGGFIAADSVSGVAVENGVFTVEIDIDITPENREYRWLEITVTPTGGGTSTTLSPRQLLSAAPFASVDLNEPWTRTPNNFLSFGTQTQTEAVLINRDFTISPAEYFGIGADTSGFAGMYAWTSQNTGLPFYGYSAGGDIDAYSYYSGALGKLLFHVNGSDRFSIGPTTDASAPFSVSAGASARFFVDPFDNSIQIGAGNGTTTIDIIGDITLFDNATVSQTLSAGEFQYTSTQNRSTTVLGSEFIPEIDFEGAITHFRNSNLTSAFGNTVLLAQVDLPVGAVVQGMEVFVNDQTSSRGINIQLRRRVLNTARNEISQLFASFTSGTSAFRNPTQGGFVPVFGAQAARLNDSFFLEAVSLGGWTFAESLSIRGVRIDYTVPAPD